MRPELTSLIADELLAFALDISNSFHLVHQ